MHPNIVTSIDVSIHKIISYCVTYLILSIDISFLSSQWDDNFEN